MSLKRKLAVYDMEILPNLTICCVKPVGQPIITFEISSRRNDIQEMVDFFQSNEYIFVGYNNLHYDGPIMNMLIINKYKYFYADYLQATGACFELSGKIMSKDKAANTQSWMQYKSASLFPQIDLMTMMASQALRVGLKPLQVTMCYPNVQEMMVDWNNFLPREKIDILTSYCHNDVNSTTELLKLLKGDLQLRMGIEKQFGISCLSKDGVGIGVEIFTKRICAELGLKNQYALLKLRDNLDVIPVRDFLLPEIKFQHPKFQEVLRHYQGMVLDNEGKGPNTTKTVVINKLAHTFGLGGIHSINKPAIYTAGDGWHLLDADVGSMYPSMLLAWGFGPKGFKEAFARVMQAIYKERMHAKRTGDKLTDKTMKLALNSIIGNLKQEYSAYFAPEANVAICVNGQLFLAMLIERLEAAGIEVIMSNTDGITSRVHDSQLDEYYKICNEWVELSRIELEYVFYEKMVMLAVNDYVAFKAGYWKEKDGKKEWVPGFSDMKDKYDFPMPEDAIEYNFAFIKHTPDALLMAEYEKQKGAFITYPRVGKGLDSLIVPKALINYYGRGIPIEDTIRNFRSINDYTIMQKVGKQFNVEWNGEPQQHINRFYASKNKPYLMKWKMVPKKDKKTKKPIISKSTGEIIEEKSYSNLLAGQGVMLANDLTGNPEYNINFQYYIAQARALIQKLEPIQISLF